MDEKCVRYFAADPEEWVNNFIQARIFSTKQEIYQNEIRRMIEDKGGYIVGKIQM